MEPANQTQENYDNVLLLDRFPPAPGNKTFDKLKFSLSFKYSQVLHSNKIIIASPEAVVEIIRSFSKVSMSEQLWVLLLDLNGRIAKILHHPLNDSDNIDLYFNLIIKQSLKNRAPKIILAHSHNISQKIEPNDYHKSINKRIQEKLIPLGLEIFDYLVITRIGFSSFLRSGILYVGS